MPVIGPTGRRLAAASANRVRHGRCCWEVGNITSKERAPSTHTTRRPISIDQMGSDIGKAARVGGDKDEAVPSIEIMKMWRCHGVCGDMRAIGFTALMLSVPLVYPLT